MESNRTRRAFLSYLATGTAAGLGGCSVFGAGDEPATGRTSTPTGNRPAANASAPADMEDVYVRLYEEVVESVVLVRVPGGGLGSGFRYGDEHVVTNYHVVTDAETVEVRYARGQVATGEVVGTDSYSDLAVVRPESQPEYAGRLPLHPEEPAIGQRVAVVGSPYGLEGSMTNGIVSGVDRVVPSPQGEFEIPNAIQTDAPVNPGNSGGPLVNLDAEVLGVVNAGGGENIAFAISAALVERVVPTLISEGAYDHPYLGIDTVDVTPAVARANDLDRTSGVLVTDVAGGSPAAGVLQPSTDTEQVDGFQVPVGGDIVLSLGDHPVESPRDLRSTLELNATPGQPIQLSLRRDGERMAVSVEVGALEQFR